MVILLDPGDDASARAGQGPATPSVRTLAGEVERRLAAAGIEGARSEAWLLLAAATGRDRAELVARGELRLEGGDWTRLCALLERRLAREPVAYVLGEKEFWSLAFRVGPGVLVPRPESETLVEAALATVADRMAPLRILDLGTGSGCLLLALLAELPEATGIGVDDSEAVLETARDNAARLGLAERAGFARSDWGRGLDGPFDLIVCNPPYVAAADWPGLAPEIREFEPKNALTAGADGLDAYRALAPGIARLLAAPGVACLELGQGQRTAVAGIMQAAGLDVAGTRPDLAGIERCLVLRRASA